jgi:hypothetical protein
MAKSVFTEPGIVESTPKPADVTVPMPAPVPGETAAPLHDAETRPDGRPSIESMPERRD